MTDYKEKIQRLQQLVNEQEDRIIALEDKLKSSLTLPSNISNSTLFKVLLLKSISAIPFL